MQIQVTNCVIPVTAREKMVFAPPGPARPGGVLSAGGQRNHFAKGDEGFDFQVFDFEFHRHSILVTSNVNVGYGTSFGAPPNPDRALAIAVRGYAPAPAGPPEQLIAWVAEGWPAYVWSFPTGTGIANVGYGLLRSRFEGDRAELHRRLRDLLPAADPDPASLRAHHLPFSSFRPPPGRGRLLLAGDAASLVNPLSGEGIYYALASGRLAARAALLAPDRPAEAYRRLLAGVLGRHLRHAAVLARAIRSPALAEAGLAAAAVSPAIFDVLVELGLGQARITPRLLAALPGGLLRARRAKRACASPRPRDP